MTLLEKIMSMPPKHSSWEGLEPLWQYVGEHIDEIIFAREQGYSFSQISGAIHSSMFELGLWSDRWHYGTVEAAIRKQLSILDQSTQNKAVAVNKSVLGERISSPPEFRLCFQNEQVGVFGFTKISNKEELDIAMRKIRETLCKGLAVNGVKIKG